jgi:4-hydroxybenzoyl-CoA reductase beta subunit
MGAMQELRLQRPKSIAEAATLLATEPGARLLAGGTDLVPNLRRGIERPPVLIDLAGVPHFADIAFSDTGLSLGAGVTLARLAADARVAADYPALAEAARSVAGPAHRSVATLGGNLCLDTRCVFYNQSEWWRATNDYCLKRGGETCHVAPQGHRCHAAFCGDLAPALLVLRAEVELVSSRGTRCVPVAELYRDDGAAHLTIGREVILTKILVPAASAAMVSGYRKARVRGAIDFPLAGVACAMAMVHGVLSVLRVALTGTNSHPLVLEGTEALLGRPVDEQALAALGKLVQKQVSPMRTTVTASNYRRQVGTVLAQRLLRELGEREPLGARMRSFPATRDASGDASRTQAEAQPQTLNAAAVLLERGDPRRTALVCGTQSVTYATLRDDVARAAAVWRNRGLARGDRVAVKLPDGMAWVRAFLGTIWAGGVAVAVNPRIPAEDWEGILREAEFRFILAESRDAAPLSFRDRVVVLDEWLQDTANASPISAEAMQEADPAFWGHSSGTSGRPKAVVHAHRFAARIAEVSAAVLGVRADDRLFASSKLFFAYSQTNSLFAGLRLGATVILDPQWPNAASVAATVAAHRATVLFSVPSLYRNLLKEGLAPRLAKSGVRLYVSAGEALPTALHDQWRRQTGIGIVNGYGASETLVLVLVDRGDGEWLTPSPGVEVQPMDSSGDAVPTRLLIKAPTLSLGYWNRPDAQAAHFSDGAFCPADLFERGPAGTWRFAGREDSLVKIHGRWVNLIELENRLVETAPGIAEAAAVCVPDGDGVDAVAVFYVASPGSGEDVGPALQAWAEALPRYQRPRWMHGVATLPRTATGKLMRRRLKELHGTLT